MRGVNAAARTRRAEWRDVGTLQAIDRQLELLSAVSESIRRLGGRPDTSLIDQLLDERWECQWADARHAANVATPRAV